MSAEEAAARNGMHLAERGPALSYAYIAIVLARSPGSGEVLLGGLGAMGVGQMWVRECPAHANYPGYREAVIAPIPPPHQPN